MSERVYLVYNDTIENSGIYVIAKNRKEAAKVADIAFTNIKWCPWLRVTGDNVHDSHGSVKGKIYPLREFKKIKTEYELYMEMLGEKDLEINQLQSENKALREKLSTCKNDYWVMTYFLENYSTDKEEAVKGCIERMKFRKPLFNELTQTGGKGSESLDDFEHDSGGFDVK